MKPIQVELSPIARKAYEKLYRADRRLFERVDRALDRLRTEPLVGKPLQGPLAGRRSLRVGAVRVLYSYLADQLLISVIDIGQRGRVYR